MHLRVAIREKLASDSSPRSAFGTITSLMTIVPFFSSITSKNQY